MTWEKARVQCECSSSSALVSCLASTLMVPSMQEARLAQGMVATIKVRTHAEARGSPLFRELVADRGYNGKWQSVHGNAPL